jgi:hypothetical protein
MANPGALDDDCVSRARREMLGRGFALVDTPLEFESGMARERKSVRIILASNSKHWWKFPQLEVYANRLERLLGAALPDETLALADLELRYEPAGAEDKEVDRLHVDGAYLRSVCTLYGPTTIYFEGKVEHAVPFGQTLLMTALARATAMRIRGTLHRRPGSGPKRAVIVCSFEPRKVSASG